MRASLIPKESLEGVRVRCFHVLLGGYMPLATYRLKGVFCI